MDWGDWIPQESVIKNIEKVLEPACCAQGTDENELSHLENIPYIHNYLLLILGNSRFSEDIRSFSGTLLKKIVKKNYRNPNLESTQTFKNECLRLLKDPSLEVRKIIGDIIVAIDEDNLETWAELFDFLTTSFVAQDENSEVALTTLSNICEQLIDAEKPDTEIFKITKEVFPKLVEFVAVEKHRKSIIKLTNEYLNGYFAVMKQSIDLGIYLRNVMRVANTFDLQLVKSICYTFILYIYNHEETLLPHLRVIIRYLLAKCHHVNQEVALQACQFFLAATNFDSCKDMVSPHLQKLIPTLLKNMRLYSDLGATRYSLAIYGNKEYLIKYFLSSERNNIAGTEDCCSSDKIDDDSDDFNDFNTGWTLRKCSAAALESIAEMYGAGIIPLIIPHLGEMLEYPDHLVKESAILALGCLAKGCSNGLKSQLPKIIRFLISCMNVSHVEVRVTACWTLSRYVSWIVSAESKQEHFVPVLTVLLKLFNDDNVRVQRSALKALCVFQREATLELVPHIAFILDGYKKGFEQLRSHSLPLLYGAIGLLVQSVGTRMSRDKDSSKLLAPLMNAFTELKDLCCDRRFTAVLQCLSKLIPTLGESFLPYTEMVYWHCLQMMNDDLDIFHNCVNGKEDANLYEPPVEDPAYAAQRVLHSMALELNSRFVEYVTDSNLICLLYTTMQDFWIRDISVALYGKLIDLCHDYLASTLDENIPRIVENLYEHTDYLSDKAAWALRQLCLLLRNHIREFIPDILDGFVHVLGSPEVDETTRENVGVSLCTIFYIYPSEIVMVPDLDVIVTECCSLVKLARDSIEKDIAFRGLSEVICQQPQFDRNLFSAFCDAAASCDTIPESLRLVIRKVLLFFKGQCEDEDWRRFYLEFPQPMKIKFHDLYGVTMN